MRTVSSAAALLAILLLANNVSSAQSDRGRHDEITLERTSGYGPGYLYTVNVRKDGQVTWLGQAGVRVMGKARSRISKSSAAKLFDFAHSINFFSAPQVRVDNCVSDGPEVEITVSEEGHERQISSYCEEMKGLGKFADEIDKEVHTIQWIFVDVPSLNKLISTGSLNTSKLGAEYMEKAVEWDFGDVIGVLAKHGVDVNRVGSNNQTYLMTAVLENKYQAARALLEARANPAVRDQRMKETPAINAGYRGAMMVKLFLDKHVPLDDADQNGGTMLMAAASQGHLDAVRLIVKAGANVNARNAKGQTAISIAEEYRNRSASSEASEEVINYLQQRGGVR